MLLHQPRYDIASPFPRQNHAASNIWGPHETLHSTAALQATQTAKHYENSVVPKYLHKGTGENAAPFCGVLPFLGLSDCRCPPGFHSQYLGNQSLDISRHPDSSFHTARLQRTNAYQHLQHVTVHPSLVEAGCKPMASCPAPSSDTGSKAACNKSHVRGAAPTVLAAAAPPPAAPPRPRLVLSCPCGRPGNSMPNVRRIISRARSPEGTTAREGVSAAIWCNTPFRAMRRRLALSPPPPDRKSQNHHPVRFDPRLNTRRVRGGNDSRSSPGAEGADGVLFTCSAFFRACSRSSPATSRSSI